MSPIYPTLPEQLTDQHHAAFRAHGYIAFEQLLSPESLEAAREAMSRIVRLLHGEAVAGSDTVRYAPPQDGVANYSGASIHHNAGGSLSFEHSKDPLAVPSEQAELMLRKLFHFEKLDPYYTDLVRSDLTRGVIEQLLGESAILFQVMALVKPARFGSEKPWHQDNAYFSFAPLDRIVGAWIALDDATPENGCMHVIPGGHRTGARQHIHDMDCRIEPDLLDVERAVPVPLPAGGAMFFYGMLPHQTPPNRSDRRRRALQFHYRGESTRQFDPEEYARDVFVDPDGHPSSCAAAKQARPETTEQPA